MKAIELLFNENKKSQALIQIKNNYAVYCGFK